DSFCFEIEPDQERLTSVVVNDISDDSSNDPLLEEVNLFLASDNSIPPGIGNIDYDSEGDIHFLEELLIDNSIPFLENKASDFDHQDDPLFTRPPSEPPNVEFNFEPNSGEVISAVMNNINEDECFDPGGEINVFTNVEDDDYFPFIFVIRIFLLYLIYPDVSPLLLSSRSEDIIFDPGISESIMQKPSRNNQKPGNIGHEIERLHQKPATRYKGKEIAKPITPSSETASEKDSDPEQAQRDKDMQNNLALIEKYFKKIYKPTNNNLRTSSNSRNKNVDMTPRHFAKECRKPKRVKDSACHKEKMLLCKQVEQDVSLQAEQYDWLADTDEEFDEPELEAH
nr:hypothetical protein [Tanacetum cinerariifolium]